MRKQGDRVRIVAELINAHDGRSLWSETYDRELKDIFAVQNEIATAVADQMKVKLLGQSARPEAAGLSENPAAHNAVLQSDFYFQQQTADSVRKSISFLQEAVRLDPNYALAYAKLARPGVSTLPALPSTMRRKLTTKPAKPRTRPLASRLTWLKCE